MGGKSCFSLTNPSNSSDLNPESNFNFDKLHCGVNIIQNTNLMPLLDKTSSPSGHSAIPFSLLHLNIHSLNRNFDNLVN